MENRIAKVVFTRTFLHNGLDKEDLIDVINALPEDATLVGISEDYNSMTVGMVFHSEEFKVVPKISVPPSIVPHFYKHTDEDGVTFGTLNYLDVSEALDHSKKKDLSGDIKTVLIQPWAEKYKDINSTLTMEMIQDSINSCYNYDEILKDQIIYGSWVGKVTEYGKIKRVNPYQVYKIDDENQAACYDSKICTDHEWKTYEGFTKKYDYCSKCDLKK